jgi:hypothetical protein
MSSRPPHWRRKFRFSRRMRQLTTTLPKSETRRQMNHPQNAADISCISLSSIKIEVK